MDLISTRDPNHIRPFGEAIFQGLAPDGGLYVPKDERNLRDLFLRADSNQSFAELAGDVTAELLKDELAPEAARRIATQAFTFSPMLVNVEDRLWNLELYHGPSCAFKDFGASFLAASMEEYLRSQSRRAVILTATSGDTGSAVATAFHNKANIDVVILYPSGRVSPLQEKQLTTLGGNIHALEVKGSFDDCQRMVKEAFQDKTLSAALPLTSANSINIGRLLPQSFYYMWAFAQLRDTLDEELVFCVPSGNFGNLTAGVYAWTWGLPVHRFIAATNRNDVVPAYLESGLFQARPSVLTPSNAMDVGNPSNFERLQHVFNKDLNLMRALIHGERIDDGETLGTIKRLYADYGLDVCPHTAVGILAAERYLKTHMEDLGTVVVLGTAHPGKFLEVVEEATGRKPALPPALLALESKTKQATLMEPRVEDLGAWLLKTLS